MSEKIPLQDILARHPEDVLYYKLEPKDIDVFNKIVEAYDNVALVSTVDPKIAKVALWATADTKGVLLKLLKKMPVRVTPWEEYIESIENMDNVNIEES